MEQQHIPETLSTLLEYRFASLDKIRERFWEQVNPFDDNDSSIQTYTHQVIDITEQIDNLLKNDATISPYIKARLLLHVQSNLAPYAVYGYRVGAEAYHREFESIIEKRAKLLADVINLNRSNSIENTFLKGLLNNYHGGFDRFITEIIDEPDQETDDGLGWVLHYVILAEESALLEFADEPTVLINHLNTLYDVATGIGMTIQQQNGLSSSYPLSD